MNELLEANSQYHFVTERPVDSCEVIVRMPTHTQLSQGRLPGYFHTKLVDKLCAEGRGTTCGRGSGVAGTCHQHSAKMAPGFKQKKLQLFIV